MENRARMSESNKPQRNKNNGKSKSVHKPKSKSASAMETKKDNYNVFCKKNILSEVRNTATSSFSNVKRSFASLTTLLKPTGQSKAKPYAQISNLATPVKLYSPFSIETPTQVDKQAATKLREQLFLTPTTRGDLENLECGLSELNHLTNQIEQSRARKTIFPEDYDLLS